MVWESIRAASGKMKDWMAAGVVVYVLDVDGNKR